MANSIKHYIAWFHKLRNQYGVLTALGCFMYNAKHYDIDGNYKPEYTVDGIVRKELLLKEKNK